MRNSEEMKRQDHHSKPFKRCIQAVYTFEGELGLDPPDRFIVKGNASLLQGLYNISGGMNDHLKLPATTR